jgi:DNA-binding response OmpR family regulator
MLDKSVEVTLFDRRTPDISGDQVLGEIEARSLDCRVALVTGAEPDGDVVEQGFDGSLVDPISRPAIEATVASVRVQFRGRRPHAPGGVLVDSARLMGRPGSAITSSIDRTRRAGTLHETWLPTSHLHGRYPAISSTESRDSTSSHHTSVPHHAFSALHQPFGARVRRETEAG